MRQELAEKYDAPMGTKERMMYVDNPQLAKVRSAAKALLHSGSKIPVKRRNELEEVVRSYHNINVLSEELLKKTVEINVKVENRNFQGLHGERVVRSVISEGKLPEFVRLWRRHFLEYMQPKYLPAMWSVDHNLHKIQSQNSLVETTKGEAKSGVVL